MKQTGKAQGSTSLATQDERNDDLNQETRPPHLRLGLPIF